MPQIPSAANYCSNGIRLSPAAKDFGCEARKAVRNIVVAISSTGEQYDARPAMRTMPTALLGTSCSLRRSRPAPLPKRDRRVPSRAAPRGWAGGVTTNADHIQQLRRGRRWCGQLQVTPRGVASLLRLLGEQKGYQ
jgi:hypothetical protein